MKYAESHLRNRNSLFPCMSAADLHATCVCVCVNKLNCVLLSLCFDPDSTSDLSVDGINRMFEVSLCFSSRLYVCVCVREL